MTAQSNSSRLQQDDTDAEEPFNTISRLLRHREERPRDGHAASTPLNLVSLSSLLVALHCIMLGGQNSFPAHTHPLPPMPVSTWDLFLFFFFHCPSLTFAAVWGPSPDP
ncbi:hypothetical protein BKA81DRAFT_349610 [Phyllosticta paracitricarpa]